jgi:hypothetical protein
VADKEDKKPGDRGNDKTVTIIVEATPHQWPKNEAISYAQVVTLARNSFAASFLPEAAKAKHLAAVDAAAPLTELRRNSNPATPDRMPAFTTSPSGSVTFVPAVT